MILEEKVPPPPYIARSTRTAPKLSNLPHNILLNIIHAAFPQSDGPLESDTKDVRQRETLHWLQTSLRLVNISLYIACMHILRSTYLPAYNTLIRPPYTSDPFPPSSESLEFAEDVPSRRPLLFSSHRELRTLDLFIALLTREDLLLDSTSLHNPRHEAYKDLFVLLQPRSRLEDLIALEGKHRGLVTLPDDPVSPSTRTPAASVSAPSLRHSESMLSLASEATLTNSAAQTSKKSDEDMSSPYVMTLPSSRSSTFHYTDASSSALTLPQRPPNSQKKKSILSIFQSRNRKKNKAPAPASLPPSPPPRGHQITPVSFSNLSVSFTPRTVGLFYTPPSTPASYGGSTYGSLSLSHHMYSGRKRLILEVPRGRDEPLEASAVALVRGLRTWLEEQ
ncbi:hypothetical protein Moror_2016 [Moniliophthora roreri MCA 2997]|uniref:Uncharacterized protein n=2 Tax=Moniliophthora roreri TaxID=221103 RepID=V2X414_MONRO|nr:hypothetical protein Moror_2016 [Moniliophthora roreri MCA 2997]KAI3610707.1 hypothetical protein WG66_007233 [Moniliophthora roreri]